MPRNHRWAIFVNKVDFFLLIILLEISEIYLAAYLFHLDGVDLITKYFLFSLQRQSTRGRTKWDPFSIQVQCWKVHEEQLLSAVCIFSSSSSTDGSRAKRMLCNQGKIQRIRNMSNNLKEFHLIQSPCSLAPASSLNISSEPHPANPKPPKKKP